MLSDTAVFVHYNSVVVAACQGVLIPYKFYIFYLIININDLYGICKITCFWRIVEKKDIVKNVVLSVEICLGIKKCCTSCLLPIVYWYCSRGKSAVHILVCVCDWLTDWLTNCHSTEVCAALKILTCFISYLQLPESEGVSAVVSSTFQSLITAFFVKVAVMPSSIMVFYENKKILFNCGCSKFKFLNVGLNEEKKQHLGSWLSDW